MLIGNLKTKIELHSRWLMGEAGGTRIDLCQMDLKDANLENAILSDGSFCLAKLRRADLQNADLSESDMRRADLRLANLCNANMRNSDLRGADLYQANLCGTDLWGAKLDYSCMPLCKGDLRAHYDDRQIIQQLYHVLCHAAYSKNCSPCLKHILLTKSNIDTANKFHKIGGYDTIK